jgi:recombination protein RecR
MAKRTEKQPVPPSRGPGAYPGPVERLVSALAALPGIGRRSAERVAFHILKSPPEEARALSDAVLEVKRSVRHCPVCYNFTNDDLCAVCVSASRDASVVMVVEQPRDLLAMEFTGMYRGVYHVLMGRLSPLEGVGPSDITLPDLVRRIDEPGRNAQERPVAEVILALNPTLEGDGTALYIAEVLRSRAVTVTRLARGLAAGSSLELTNKAVLADALEGRRAL